MHKPKCFNPIGGAFAFGLVVILAVSCTEQNPTTVPQPTGPSSLARSAADQVNDAEWNRDVGLLLTPEASRTAYDFLRAKGLPNSWGIQLIKSGFSMGMLTGDRQSVADLFGMVLRTSEGGGGTMPQVQQAVLDIEPAVVQLSVTFRYDRTRARNFVTGALAARMAMRKFGEDKLAEEIPSIASAFASREKRTRLYGVMSAAGVDPGLLRAALEQGEFSRALELFMQTASNLERASDQAELDVLNELRGRQP